MRGAASAPTILDNALHFGPCRQDQPRHARNLDRKAPATEPDRVEQIVARRQDSHDIPALRACRKRPRRAGRANRHRRGRRRAGTLQCDLIAPRNAPHRELRTKARDTAAALSRIAPIPRSRRPIRPVRCRRRCWHGGRSRGGRRRRFGRRRRRGRPDAAGQEDKRRKRGGGERTETHDLNMADARRRLNPLGARV